MNRKRKGWYYERKAREILEGEGYYVIRSAGSFGLFDLVGIRKGDGKVRLIQVKSGRAKVKEDEIKLMEEFKGERVSVEIWEFKKRGLKIRFI